MRLCAGVLEGTEVMITDAMVEAAKRILPPMSDERCRAALEAAEKAAWQPIETAPKDHTTILLRGPSGYRSPRDFHIETGYWHVAIGAWLSDSGDRITEGWPEPTYWQPLPEPPKA